MAANPTFSNNTYAGELFDELIAPVILDPSGLEDHGLATVIDRTKDKRTIYELDDSVDFQDASPLFQDQNTQGDIDEINLSLVPYDFGKILSFDTIRTSWYSGKLAPGSLEDYTYDELVAKYIENIYAPLLQLGQNTLVAQGKNSPDARVAFSFAAGYNGVYDLFDAATGTRSVTLADSFSVDAIDAAANPTVLSVTATPLDDLYVGNIISIRNAGGTGWAAINGDFEILAMTATTVTIDVDTSTLNTVDYDGNGVIRFINRTNIVDVLANHLTRIPTAVRRMGAKIVLPSHLEMEWQLANAVVQQNGGSYVLDSYNLKLIDQSLVILDSAPANYVATWLAKHVFYGYDLANDVSNLMVKNMAETTLDFVYRIRGNMKTGVAITNKFESEITLTTPND